jgi:acyl-coenzyme A synthetase/AMP-(fatty) acid ligase
MLHEGSRAGGPLIGRSGGIINVGGLKVHPEEIAVINRHPEVRMSLVSGRKNPITGAIVVAEIVDGPRYPERHSAPGACYRPRTSYRQRAAART